MMAADLNGEGAAETAALITGSGARANSFEVDVTKQDQVAQMVAATVAEFEGLDTVINNAGVTIVGAAHDLDESDWDRELDVNLKSVYLVSKAAWPHLEQGGVARSPPPHRSLACGRSPTTRLTAPRRRA